MSCSCSVSGVRVYTIAPKRSPSNPNKGSVPLGRFASGNVNSDAFSDKDKSFLCSFLVSTRPVPTDVKKAKLVVNLNEAEEKVEKENYSKYMKAQDKISNTLGDYFASLKAKK